VDNRGYSSIGSLSRSLGSSGFGTHFARNANRAQPLDDPSGKGPAGELEPLPIDLGANAESLGAKLYRAESVEELREALAAAHRDSGPVVIHIEVDRYAGVPSYEGWWDVPVAEVSRDPAVRAAREQYERDRARQRSYLEAP
jgi:3D-(3,5/4)-trihydroxycyclohexane-1,2-dione acylhydrolase (decyclizing)